MIKRKIKKGKKMKKIKDFRPNMIRMLIFGIVVSLMIKYLLDLEKNEDCKCAVTETSKMLKNLLIVLLVLVVLNMMLSFNKTILFVTLSLQIILFVYVAYLYFVYERELKKANCDCSDDIKKTLFKIYLYFRIIIVVLSLLLLSLFLDVSKK
tara:strand:- start:66 stop:521 length:456 start_codon:yes stop_codon:yes gene_type:complete